MRIAPAIAIFAIAAPAFLGSCKEEERAYVTNVGDGETTPTMVTYDVNTFISDSGYTRYYITTPIWRMHDEAAQPFWKFPDGLQLEQYDRDLNITATMVCDSATYLSQKRIWRLDGNVVMVNPARDSFLTQQVFWDQGYKKVYSDSFIHIVRSDRIIEGYGFVSNENMTEYTVNDPTGIFPVNRSESTASSERDSAFDNNPRRRRPSMRSSSSLISADAPADTLLP